MKDYDKLKELLGNEEWPGEYLFKFIVLAEKLTQVTTLIGDANFTTRPSRNGKYISVSAKKMVQGPDEIVEVYKRLSMVEGIVSL